MSCFCATTCMAWVIRTGNSRRRRTGVQFLFGRTATGKLGGQQFAVATASWTQRLTPTPPIGDHRMRGVADAQ